MKIVSPGHQYEVKNLDHDSFQALSFIQKQAKPGSTTGEMETLTIGTTNEEVLAVLIDRLRYLNGKFPCIENEVALRNLEEALTWLNKRTADRAKRGVEGKHVA